MNFTEKFDRYLNLFRLRLKQLLLARGSAALAVSALIITVAAVAIAIRSGFPDDQIIMARLILIAALGALFYLLIVRPNRKIDRNASAEIETRTPAFRGRVETYVEMQGNDNPMRELLAEDTLRVAQEHPPEKQVVQKEFTLALATASIAVIGLLFLALAGPGNYAYGVRHLWFGWAFPNLLPPQSIEVTPGDDGIRLGGTVNVRATMQGFAPGEAWVNASFGNGEWQRVEMAEGDDEFEFTFFSVRESLQYYVSTTNVRSPTYQVSVVDLPVVENLALTYHFPEWTDREPETVDPGGDVRAIVDTEIEIQIKSDRAMTPGELIVDDQAIPLRIDGDTASARFQVAQDGQYFVAAKVGGEQIRLTDDYFITLLEDESPTIEFARPGRDWSASGIEEVTARIMVEDDFQLESLELRYSVNGADWQSIDLPVATQFAEVDHVFLLENMSVLAANTALVPGDLVSYYAVATDRENSARTDIFFIDVQPFDRRYSQSQQSGQQGGQQGPQQDEISQRQREIIVSTWNLIREQQENRGNDDAFIADNAALLSRVQATLKDQVETLALRTQARQLTASAEDIAIFVENLNKAAEVMVRAAERLGEIDLEQALLPEQEALQHLLAAEAVFTDISVSMQANNRGGAGGQAGRDLTEMFEMEMDLEKNQYETGSSASPNPQQQNMDEAAEDLSELARRQQQLAKNLKQNQTPTPAQRWQQEMLRREVEELRERLEQMQERSAASQSQSQQAQNGQEGSAGSPSSQSANGEDVERQMDELQRRLDSAVRAMNDATREGSTPEDLRRAADEASRQLEGARDRAIEEREQAMQAAVGDLAERANDLYESQAALDEKLQDAIRGVEVGTNEFNRLDSGMTFDEEMQMAEDKRRLQTKIQQLEQDTRNTALQIDDQQPDAANQLRAGVEKLRDLEIETRIAVAAAYIEQGEAVYVAASESAVTDALRQLREDIERAERMVGRGNGEPGEAGAINEVAESLAETQQLRRNLQQMTQGNANSGAPNTTGRDDLPRPSGMRVGDVDISREVEDQAESLSQAIPDLFRGLRAAGTSAEDIDELRQLAAEIRATEFSGNPELLEREARLALSLVEQLELALAKTARQDREGVWTNTADEIPDAHREVIADYYRRLGESGDSPDQ
jgi:hypothetical protein